jgi:hypothetical protein
LRKIHCDTNFSIGEMFHLKRFNLSGNKKTMHYELQSRLFKPSDNSQGTKTGKQKQKLFEGGLITSVSNQILRPSAQNALFIVVEILRNLFFLQKK